MISIVGAIDLFCGAGGFTQGARDSGVEVLAGFDNNEKALKTYMVNHGTESAVKEDLSTPHTGGTVGVKDFHGVNLVMGSPPCQDFSPAGAREEKERAQLTVTFAHIVAGLRPRYFVMENVPQAQDSYAWNEGKKRLDKAGYAISEVVLNAANYGVPQNRRRFFAIGSIVDTWNPRQFEWELAGLDTLHPMTMRDKVADRWGEAVYINPRSYNKRAIFSIDEPAPTMRCGLRPMPKTYRRHPGDASGDPHILSVADMALLQGFTAGYRWPEAKTIAAEQIGNAVPPPLVKAVIEASLYLERDE